MISPCIGICQIDLCSRYCKGCYRTIDEISEWYFATDDEKKQIINAIEERRIQ